MDSEQTRLNQILKESGIDMLEKDSTYSKLSDELKAVALGIITVNGTEEPITLKEIQSGGFDEKREFDKTFFEEDSDEIKKYKSNLKLMFLTSDKKM